MLSRASTLLRRLEEEEAVNLISELPATNENSPVEDVPALTVGTSTAPGAADNGSGATLTVEVTDRDVPVPSGGTLEGQAGGISINLGDFMDVDDGDDDEDHAVIEIDGSDAAGISSMISQVANAATATGGMIDYYNNQSAYSNIGFRII